MKKQQGQGRAAHRRTRQQTMAQVWKCRWLYLMMLPVVVYFIVFKYIPMYGITIAFQDYNIFKGMFGSTWWGFTTFKKVGQFGTSADVSAVATGSMIMNTVTVVMTGLTMGLTVLLERKIGEG